MLLVALAVLKGDRVEAVRVHDDEAVWSERRYRAVFAVLVAKLDDKPDALERSRLEELTVPALRVMVSPQIYEPSKERTLTR